MDQVATVELGPDLREGLAEFNGQGEAVGGIVVMRFGENALSVIKGVKAKIAQLKDSLPPEVRIVPVYDRSQLILRSIGTLKEKLIEESIIVSLVCVLFLWHLRSALVAIIMLPMAVLLSFIPFAALHLTANIMSLERYSHCHRCDGRCSHYHDRECPQGTGTSATGQRI